MKSVIREGVFETNSSSTHSVSFVTREEKTVNPDSSYELHSPFAKLMFLIGLCENAARIPSYYEDEPDEEQEEVAVELLGGEDIMPFTSDRDLCEMTLQAVKNEYMAMEGIGEEELNRRIAESEFTCEGMCLCRNFFDDDVLDSCTCPFEGYSGIVNSLKLYRLYTKNEFAEYARWFLAPEQKFVLKEYWCGMQLICSGEVY